MRYFFIYVDEEFSRYFTFRYGEDDTIIKEKVKKKILRALSTNHILNL